MVFVAKVVTDSGEIKASEFQSLIGVYGFCGEKDFDIQQKKILVSIPDRGLWFLWPFSSLCVSEKQRFNP